METADLYHDYNLILQMIIPCNIKVKLLRELFEASDNPWRVVGITEAALRKFEEHNFRKESGMGIQRAHLNNRNNAFLEMLNTEFHNSNEWWNFYYERDKTILALSTENRGIENGIINYIEINEKLGLFRSNRISWKHSRAEIDILTILRTNLI
jgi:hypothetical protein